MSDKITVVYQDTKGRCRVLVNPANIEKYLHKDNVAINPPIESLLSEGATPDRWYIEGGQIHVKTTKEPTEYTKLDIYDLFLDVQDKKAEMQNWVDVKRLQFDSLSNEVVSLNSRLARLDRYIKKVEKGSKLIIGLICFIAIVGVLSTWLIK